MNNITVNDGDTVTLDCQADGNPRPAIRWIFNNSSYVPGLFSITGKHNEGCYRCIAENSVGRDESTRDVCLTVFCKSNSNLAAIVSKDRVIKNMVIFLVILSISIAKQSNFYVLIWKRFTLLHIFKVTVNKIWSKFSKFFFFFFCSSARESS